MAKPNEDPVARVKLKILNKSSKPTINTVLTELYVNLNLPLIRLIEQTDSLIAIVKNSKEAEKLLCEKAEKVLSKLCLEAVEHPKLKAQRTLVFKRIDPHVGDRNAEEIEEEILENQDWAKVKQVIKINNYSHIFKVEFRDIETANKILDNGLLLFNMAIIPSQIERDFYCEVMMCFKCYKLESHYSSECPDKNKIVCSDCSATDHTFKDCTNNTFKKCLNCEGNHKTTSMSCPKRKEIVKNKMSQLNQKKQSYAAIAESNLNVNANFSTMESFPVIDTKASTKILACLIYAHLNNSSNPGTFNLVANEMLSKNGLPRVEFPENPPSAEIIEGPNSPSESTDSEDEVPQQNMYNLGAIERKQRKKRKRTQQSNKSSKRVQISNSPEAANVTASNCVSTQELGLTIYSTKSNKPTNDETLKYALLQGKVKWTSVNKSLTQEKLLQCAKDDKLILVPASLEVVTYGELSKIPINKHKHASSS